MQFLKLTAICIATACCTPALAQEETDEEEKTTTPVSKVPFDGYDLSWINGQNRQTDFPLTLKDKNGETILTGVAYVDAYYNFDFHKPQDNTHTISSSIGRSNE